MTYFKKPIYTLRLRDIIWQAIMANKLWSATIIFVAIAGYSGAILWPIYFAHLTDFLAQLSSAKVFDLHAFWPILIVGICGWLGFNVPRTTHYIVTAEKIARMRQVIRAAILHDLYQKDVAFYHDRFVGSIATSLRDISESATLILEDILFNFIPVTVYLSVLITMLNIYHPLYLVPMAVWLIVRVVVLFFTTKNIQNRSRHYADMRSQAFGDITDSLTNHQSVRAFNASKQEEISIKIKEDKVVHARAALMHYMNGSEIFLEIIDTFVMFGLILGVFIYLFNRGLAQPTDFIVVSLALSNMMNKVSYLNERILLNYEQIGVAQDAITKLFVPPKIIDTLNAQPLRIEKEAIIQLDHVNFSYQQDKEVLQDISFTIQAGEKIGLVGYSGAGKSTLAHLLLRHYDIQKGAILINDQDISKITLHSLRQAISFIPQDISLFHRSLADNIRIAKPDATMQEIIHAAQLAGADDFISVLPNGYDTLVGERGVKLSGGQRQRVAIARAFLHGAPILILDEATSALDSVTEAAIQSALDRVMAQRTSLVIAHRLSTLRRMDRIIVMDRGRIIEQGTHDQLLAMPSGHYARMWAMQAGGFLPEQETA